MARNYMQKGDSGAKVKALQANLIALGYSVGSYGADGVYGNDTVNAVKKFQKDRKLTVDGIAGVKTLAKIDGLLFGGNVIRILLDAGHGAGKAHNRGSVCSNEGDNNYRYSLVLKEELESYGNVVVHLVRNNINDNPSLTNRSNMGAGYDLFLSLHSNAAAASVRGTEVFDSVEKPNLALAKLLVDATAEFFKHNNRGVKYREGQPGYNWYGVLRFNGARSAMIIENGFHTNSVDCSIYKDKHKELAVVQARAIASHYGLKKKAVKEAPKNNKPSEWAKEAWEWGIKEGITDGSRPKDTPTREQVVAMIRRSKEVK